MGSRDAGGPMQSRFMSLVEAVTSAEELAAIDLNTGWP
jgi:hypothetical protein